jgi:predicted nucleic acid-binding protein
VSPPYDPASYARAHRVMDEIDPDDTEFLTVAYMKNLNIWSNDPHFDGIPDVRRVTTREIKENSFRTTGIMASPSGRGLS